jgi:tRNA modification GTPase
MSAHFIYDDGPIIACSTGNVVNSAISVIRISGFKNLDFLNNKLSINYKKIKPRYAHFTKLFDNKKLLDEIILTYFPAPHSFNGENIIELSVHGNILNVNRIIDFFINNGFRSAKPGEFAYRALKNKKLNLSQVEGLDLLLNATSTFTLDQGFSLYSGDIQKVFLELLDSYINHKSALELGIDFLDDVGEEGFNQNFKTTLEKFHHKVLDLQSHTNNLASKLIKPEILIWGLPNAGKSTFFNSLLRKERSIVSDIAGTTRDYVSHDIFIDGVLYNLVDTAGIRDTDNQIEKMGIEKAMKLAEGSFFNILLVDPAAPPREELNFLVDKVDLLIFSHMDKHSNIKEIENNVMKKFKTTYSIQLNLTKNLDFGSIGPRISSKFLNISSSNPLILDRHRTLVNEIYLKTTKYIDTANNKQDISIISSELNILGHCISELVGIVSPDTVLNNIFANFCIGK